MDSMQAFTIGQSNREKELMVFDWNKAAKLIRKMKAQEASAGLSGDWEWTGGTIFQDGKPYKEEYGQPYLASTWATPELDIDGKIFACYKMQSKTDNWDADTFWPESALKILNG